MACKSPLPFGLALVLACCAADADNGEWGINASGAKETLIFPEDDPRIVQRDPDLASALLQARRMLEQKSNQHVHCTRIIAGLKIEESLTTRNLAYDILTGVFPPRYLWPSELVKYGVILETGFGWGLLGMELLGFGVPLYGLDQHHLPPELRQFRRFFKGDISDPSTYEYISPQGKKSSVKLTDGAFGMAFSIRANFYSAFRSMFHAFVTVYAQQQGLSQEYQRSVSIDELFRQLQTRASQDDIVQGILAQFDYAKNRTPKNAAGELVRLLEAALDSYLLHLKSGGVLAIAPLYGELEARVLIGLAKRKGYVLAEEGLGRQRDNVAKFSDFIESNAFPSLNYEIKNYLRERLSSKVQELPMSRQLQVYWSEVQRAHRKANMDADQLHYVVLQTP